MDPLLATAAFLASIIGLWLGAEALVTGATALARRLGVSDVVIGLTVVAFGTGLPEIVVAVDAVLTGHPNIAVGNVIGSNIYNLAVVIGIVALIQRIDVNRTLVRRDGVALLGTTLLALLLLADGTLSRIEGGMLFGLWVAYIVFLFVRVRAPSAGEGSVRDPLGWKNPVRLVGGLLVVIVSGALLVESASTLARLFGLSEWQVGATIVAAGTSTPELAVSLVALLRGSTGISVGNVVGSNIVNLFGVLGLAGLIRPIAVDAAVLDGMVWLLALVVVSVLALWTGRRLSRVEGAGLVCTEAVRWVVGLT